MLTQKEVNEIAFGVDGCAIEVHKELGPGLLESVYHQCLLEELLVFGFDVWSKVKVPISYKGRDLGQVLQLDLLINQIIIVEVKAVEILHPVYKAQLLSYMRLTQKPKGLLINFHTENIVKGMVSLVNEEFQKLPAVMK